MALLSPGVEIKEIDASIITARTGGSVGVFVGHFQKGPTNQRVLLSNDVDFLDTFGEPQSGYEDDWYQVYNYLQYASAIYVTRVAQDNVLGYGADGEVVAGTVAGVVDVNGTDNVEEYTDGVFSSDYDATSGVTTGVATDFTYIGGAVVAATGNDATLLGAFEIEVVQSPEPGVLDVVVGTKLSFDGGTTFNYVTKKELVTSPNVYKLTMLDVVVASDGSGTAIPIIRQQELVNTIDITSATMDKSVNVGDILTVGANSYHIKELSNSKQTFELSTHVSHAIADGSSQEFKLSRVSSKNAVAYVGFDLNTSNVETPKTYALTDMLLVDDEEQKDSLSADFRTETSNRFFAKVAGEWGNNIEISIAKGGVTKYSTDVASIGETLAKSGDFGEGSVAGLTTRSKNYAFPGVLLDSLFEYTPLDGEYGIAIRYNGETEVFTVSMDPLAKDGRGDSMFIDDVLDKQSKFVWSQSAGDKSFTMDSYINGNTIKLQGGATEQYSKTLTIENGYGLYENKDLVDIDYVIGLDTSFGSISSLVSSRRDCLGYVAFRLGSNDVLTNFVDNIVASYSSNEFMVVCANTKVQKNLFGTKNVEVSLSGDIAGLRAETDANFDKWFAPAGQTRGQIRNVVRFLSNPDGTQRDYLYKNAINPIVSCPGQGHMLYGQKTYTNRPSVFDRVNVRNLFNHIERVIYKTSKSFVFEFNNTFTRNRFVSAVEPFLSQIQAGQGIDEFVVDMSGNTDAVIERNEFVANIVVKPVYVTEFITLTFTAINASTDITTVVGGQ